MTQSDEQLHLLLDEQFIFEHLRDFVNTTRISDRSKRLKINSCSAQDGYFVYYEKSFVVDTIKLMLREIFHDEKPTIKDTEQIIKYLIDTKKIKEKSIYIFGANLVINQRYRLDTYRIKHSFLNFTQDQLLLNQRNSEYLKNAITVDSYAVEYKKSLNH